MTYNIQVAFDTDERRTPQRIIKEIKDTNQSLTRTGDIFSFTFDLSDFQHAIEILSQTSPDSPVPHLKPYIQYAKADLGELTSLSDYFQKFKQEDLKRKSMENIGVGLSSLFMNKSFKIDWRDMSHIPKEHFPRGKRVKKADFVGFREDLRYYFEAKGTTLKKSINPGITKAKNQLRNIRYPSETKMAFVSYIPCDDLDFPPTLFISDPPVEEGIDLDIYLVRMLHYHDVLKYSGFSTALQTYSKIIREFMKKKRNESDKMMADFSSKSLERLLKKISIEFDKERGSMERRLINNFSFIGNSAQYRTQDDNYTFFRGVNYNIIKKAVVLDFSFEQLKDEIVIDEGKGSVFSDGTILHITRDSDKSRRKPPVVDKPREALIAYKALENSKSNSSHSFNTSHRNSNEQRVKEKILVRA
jgi:hypothetical protein